MGGIIERWQRGTVETLLGERRVLMLAGPRQCGKTTLVKGLESTEVEYRTLDDATHRTLADSDPEGFVRHGGATLIIDEVQRVPALFPAIKKAVDEDRRPGQFLLTGSANVQAMPAVQESLAGRIAKIRLRPFSVGEMGGGKPDFLERCFNRDFTSRGKHGAAPSPGKRSGRDALIELAMRGGFPEAVELEGRAARRRWHRDYIDALLARDLADISRIRRQEAMQELVKALAAWSAKPMDISKIGTKLSIRRPTLESYISMMEALFIVERVPAWTEGDYGRVGRRKKLFMTDSGLMASISGMRMEQVRLDPDRCGKLVETFIYNELAAQVDADDGGYSLYHYRDRAQREINFIIERDDGELLCIEVKAAASVQKGDFKHLAWFRDNAAKDRDFTGIVLYAGEHTGSYGDGLWAVSADNLLSGM